MRQVKLAPRAKQKLQSMARSASDARQVRRAQALLWLDGGESVAAVAHRLEVSRQAVYGWIEQYTLRQAEPVEQRVRDRGHLGRPDQKRQVVVQEIATLLACEPRCYGYRGLVWTAPLLQQEVQRRRQMAVSVRTVRRALHQLRYRCKRPRYVLARRAPTWRQAKGGLNVA